MKAIYDKQNVFAKILKGEIPCKKVYEDEHVLAFNDIHPDAPTHILVIPKNQYTCFSDFTQNASEEEIGTFFKVVGSITKQLKVDDFRLVTNNGAKSGQSVFHFHMHILSGKPLGKFN